MDRVELLAPARDIETGLAAINCGADAVYIGATRFGAREAAGNDLETIEQLTRYAHKYWAKVYVTVNTLLYDDELPLAVGLIQQLYQMGVDAIIIQDTGLLECDLPPLPLIASTQMHNNTLERIAFLEKVGFQRVILARELNLEQIRTIRAHTRIELESFIHGALCVSYSGQCYMSYTLGGRSGNRGQCAQPCRRLYSLVSSSGQILVKDRYLLSLRDLNLSEHLRDLLSAGVHSFKIEGRLKDKAYVMNVVAHYRRLLDNILQDGSWRPASSGRSHLEFSPDVAKTFNRGYTTYFLMGSGAESRDQIASPDTPKSIGEPLGQINSVRRESFIIESSFKLHPGDGLCFFDHQRNLKGTTVNRVEGGLVFPDRMDDLAPGGFLYRNYDHEFTSRLQKSQTERKIAVSFSVEEEPQGIALSARDEDGNEVRDIFDCEKVAAEKPDLMRASIEKQLRKLGGTEFECTQVEINLPTVYFIPLSVLNELRRRVVQRLALEREKNRPRLMGGVIRNEIPFPERELAFTGNVLNHKAEAFYQRHGVIRIEPAAESGLDLRGRKVMTTKLCLKYRLSACPKQPGSTRLEEPLYLVDEQGNRFPLRFDCSTCEMSVYWGE